MGFSGKLKEKREAIKLRKQGLTYSEIKNELNVSKNSISRWCRDIQLSDKQLKRIYGKTIKGGLKGSVIAAKNKRIRTKNKIRKLQKEGVEEIGKVSKRDFFISGIMLYAGEGTKTDGKVSFSNADPLLIKFMMQWFRDFCSINEKRYRAQLYIHDNLDKVESEKYWSNLIKVPLNQFHKVYIVKNNPDRLHKNIHKFGVLKISFNDVRIHRRLMGWIKGVIEN